MWGLVDVRHVILQSDPGVYAVVLFQQKCYYDGTPSLFTDLGSRALHPSLPQSFHSHPLTEAPAPPRLPQGPCLPKMPLPGAVDTDVSVVVITDTGFAQVLGILPPGVMLRVLHTRDATVTEEIPHRWCA